jgi:adenylosuccinate lyase
MPYKTNPILSERISSLSKFIISLNSSTDMVAITQWLERTLDDSANKRLSLPQMFLATDSILNLLSELFEGIKVNHSVINKNLQDNLPFLITENILMDLVKQGANRQTLHEEIKKLSLQALENIKEGKKNNLMDLILKNPIFNLQEQDIKAYQNEGELIGYSIEQTEYFLKDIDLLLKKNHSKIRPIHKSTI